MINVYIEAKVNYAELVALIRAVPKLQEAVPLLRLACGPFTCDTVEEVWGLVVANVNAERQSSYEALREFAP